MSIQIIFSKRKGKKGAREDASKRGKEEGLGGRKREEEKRLKRSTNFSPSTQIFQHSEEENTVRDPPSPPCTGTTSTSWPRSSYMQRHWSDSTG